MRSSGGIGRHAALKMLFSDGSAGSIPASTTKNDFFGNHYKQMGP